MALTSTSRMLPATARTTIVLVGCFTPNSQSRRIIGLSAAAEASGIGLLMRGALQTALLWRPRSGAQLHECKAESEPQHPNHAAHIRD
jgi:hypothetical protein